MYALRRIVSRRARAFEVLYALIDPFVQRLEPLLRGIGYDRVERPVALVEGGLKAVLFDCHMCGQCVLSATGMTCPMNCPKQVRNGPCGGVRANGSCEIDPAMTCVWLDAVRGSSAMRRGAAIERVLPPVDWTLAGSSAWLRHIRERAPSGDDTAASR